MSDEIERLEAELLRAKIDAATEEARKLKRINDLEESKADFARTYMFYAPISDQSVSQALYTLDNWSRRFPGQPFKIILNTPGGSVLDGFALHDFIEELRRRGHHITIKGQGICASMGAVLLQAADDRVLSRRCRLMVHEISTRAQGTRTQIDDELKFVNSLQEDALDILSERATIKRNTIKRNWKRTDWWIKPEEALKKGFIDRIED